MRRRKEKPKDKKTSKSSNKKGEGGNIMRNTSFSLVPRLSLPCFEYLKRGMSSSREETDFLLFDFTFSFIFCFDVEVICPSFSF
jgi:hypothetical protein